MRWELIAFLGLYLGALFPFAYFRHDDWMHLGNSNFFLPRDWSFLWRPTQFIFESEGVWFFRPFVKLLAYLNYQVFSLNHYSWTGLHLVLTLASVSIGARCIELITQSRYRARLFAVVFLASFHLHVGSILWVGEGIMNCPQVFALAACLYFFVKTGRTPLSILCFVASLGFKESSVFFPLFLWAIKPSRIGWKKLIPYFALAAAYLYVRLGLMPVNEGYFTHWNISSVSATVALLLVALLFPLALLSWTNRNSLTRISLQDTFYKVLRFVPFFALCVGPYVGNEFFSPGWLFYPGFFVCLATLVTLEFPLDRPKTILRVGVWATVLSLAVVLLQMDRIGWFRWKMAQTKTHAIIEALAKANIDEIHVVNCLNPKFPSSSFERVVGFQSSLYQMWKLYNPHPVFIMYRACWDVPVPDPMKKMVVLRWSFPDIQVIR